MKIVINKAYGGFGLTDEMMKAVGYKPRSAADMGWNYDRTDPKLIGYLESIPENERHGLKVVEIPDDVQWEIEEYDGMEWISEVHRQWS